MKITKKISATYFTFRQTMSRQSAIKTGVALSYFVIIFNIVAGLLYTPWMITKIGKADYGLYILVTSFLAYFTVDYGLWQAINKLVAEYHTKGDHEREHRVVNVAASLYLLIDLCIAMVLVVVFFCVDGIYTNLTDSELALFKTLFIIASGFALLAFPFIFLHGVFMGREFFVPIKIFDLLQRVGVIVITVVLLFFNCGVISLVLAFGLVPLATRLAQYGYLWRKGFRIHPVHIDRPIARSILGLSMWLFVIVLAELFVTNISPSILAKYADTTQIAIFAIGLALYNYVYAFAGAINGFFLPRVYKLRNEGKDAAILSTSTMVSGIQMFIVGLFVMGIVTVGREFITLWVGQSFETSYSVSIWVLVPVMITFCQPIETTELFATNKLYCQASMMLCTAISAVALSIFLCPRYGAVGTAIGIGVSKFLFMGIGLNIFFMRVLHRDRRPFLRLLLRYALAFSLTYGLYLGVFHYLSVPYNWGGFLIKGVIFVAIYIPTVYVIALPKSVKKSLFIPKLNKLYHKR
jgi:polysaccharide biosynthesis protein